jgi:hypothetical protein
MASAASARFASVSKILNNKRIIEFSLRRISELFRPRPALSALSFLVQFLTKFRNAFKKFRMNMFGIS